MEILHLAFGMVGGGNESGQGGGTITVVNGVTGCRKAETVASRGPKRRIRNSS
jgi:hypothetical protein